MANPFRNVALHWHRLRRTQTRVLDGVKVSTDPAQTPGFVRSALFKNTYEDAERALVARAVRSGDRVLEIGGGVGFVGLLAARLAGDGRVVSYEANPEMEPVIRGNYALNDITPELRMRAISATGGPVTFTLPTMSCPRPSSRAPKRSTPSRWTVTGCKTLCQTSAPMS